MAQKVTGVYLEAPPDLDAEQQAEDLKLVAAHPKVLGYLAPEAEKFFALHEQRVASVEADVAKHRKQLEADADRTSPRGVRQLVQPGIDKAVAEYRLERLKASADHRAEPLRELARLESLARSLERLYQSPRAVATRFAFNTEERARAAQSLRGMGPAALETIAADALARGDRVVAAALIEVVESLPTNQRPKGINTAAIADRVFGDEYKSAHSQIAIAKHRFAAAIKASRAVVRNERSDIAKIADGLNRRRE